MSGHVGAWSSLGVDQAVSSNRVKGDADESGKVMYFYVSAKKSPECNREGCNRGVTLCGWPSSELSNKLLK